MRRWLSATGSAATKATKIANSKTEMPVIMVDYAHAGEDLPLHGLQRPRCARDDFAVLAEGNAV
ncbi:MAG: hypothetical protein RLN67_01570 [Algiphilus sp.]